MCSFRFIPASAKSKSSTFFQTRTCDLVMAMYWIIYVTLRLWTKSIIFHDTDLKLQKGNNRSTGRKNGNFRLASPTFRQRPQPAVGIYKGHPDLTDAEPKETVTKDLTSEGAKSPIEIYGRSLHNVI
jgi:hypothetical protein